MFFSVSGSSFSSEGERERARFFFSRPSSARIYFTPSSVHTHFHTLVTVIAWKTPSCLLLYSITLSIGSCKLLTFIAMKLSSTLSTTSLLLILMSLTERASSDLLDDLACGFNDLMGGGGSCIQEARSDFGRKQSEVNGCCILAKLQVCLTQQAPRCSTINLRDLGTRFGRRITDCEETSFVSYECLYYFYPTVITFVTMFLVIFTCLCVIHCCRSRRRTMRTRRGVNNPILPQTQQVFTMRQEPFNPNLITNAGVVYQETTRPLVYVAPSAPVLSSDAHHALLNDGPPPSYEESRRKY